MQSLIFPLGRSWGGWGVFTCCHGESWYLHSIDKAFFFCMRFTQGNVDFVGGTSLRPVLRPKGGQDRVGPRVQVVKEFTKAAV